MSRHTAKRTFRLQFSLAALLGLTAAIGAAIALARADRVFWAMSTTYVTVPFLVGVGVGRVCTSRAQLLTAPAVAAAIVPLPWALFATIHDTSMNASLLPGFLRWWVMLFPIVLFVGAIPAFGGSALGYWFQRRTNSRDR